MKIALISPKGPLYRNKGGIFKKSLRYQPLTLTTLASLIPKELDIELQLIDEGICDVPDHIDADLVGMNWQRRCGSRGRQWYWVALMSPWFHKKQHSMLMRYALVMRKIPGLSYYAIMPVAR